MLQHRNFKFVLICLIISINHSEQRQQQQGQGQYQGRRNSLQYQQQQQQHAMRQQQSRQPDKRLIEERELKASDMLKYMNLEADICTDFYDYTCGKWLSEQSTDLAHDGDVISVQNVMEQTVSKQLKSILNEPISSYDTMASKVAKEFFQTCVRVPASSPAQKQFIQGFILNHGGLPDIKGSQWSPSYKWVYVIADLRRKYNLDILIGLRIDRSNPNHKAIYIEEPQTTLLPVELCSSLATRDLDAKDEVFDKIQNEIKDNLRNWFELSESNALRVAGSIIRFEFDLCKYMRVEQTASLPLDNAEEIENEQQPPNIHRRGYSSGIVENKMHGVRQSTSNVPQNLRTLSDNYQIEFKDFVDISLETGTVSQVYFRSEEYFQQLSIIAKKGLQASFANYIMYRALTEINFPLNEANGQRSLTCVNKIMRYLPQVLSKLYNDKLNNAEVKQEIQDMFVAIKQTFATHLQTNVEWMLDNTKKAIRQKLNSLKITFPSYPQNGDVLRGIQLHDDQDYWQKLMAIMMYSANQTIQQVRMTNDHANAVEAPAVTIQQKPMTNEFMVGYGLLQKPFYSPYYSNSLKYSSIGVAIAKEIIKMFDHQGLQQNSMNTFNWEASTTENFTLITECFRAQMSNYFHNTPNIYRNATKLREIIVETSAINIAFNAYLGWLDTPARPRAEMQLETLPDVNFTNTQLFFINFAQNLCAGRFNVEVPPEYLPLYRKSMEQFAINGPLSNNEEFGRDFSCELGSLMNVDDKCLLY